MSRYRLNASCTTRGLGEQPPLFKLMIVRSSVKACWISRQYVSSAATSPGAAPSTRRPAARTRARLSSLNAAKAAAVPVARRNERLVIIVVPLNTDTYRERSRASSEARASEESQAGCPPSQRELRVTLLRRDKHGADRKSTRLNS